MNITRKALAITTMVFVGALASGHAQAGHPDVQWSVRIGAFSPLPFLPPVPVPVVIQHQQPTAVYVQPAWRDRDRDGIADWRDHRDNRVVIVGRADRDRDRDGIPDRYDRYDNRFDNRHGNRYDHRYDNRRDWRHDRDHDGVPNWRDRNDNRR